MKTHVNRLGKPEAINWLTVLIPSFFIVPGSFVSGRADIYDRIWLFSAIVAASLVPFISTLIVGRLVLNYFARLKPKPLLTIAIFFTAISVRAFLFDALLLKYEFTQTSLVLYRIYVSIFGLLAGTFFAAIIVVSANEFALSNTFLREQVARLNELRTQKLDRIARQRQNLIDEIRQEIHAALEQLGSNSKGSANDFLRNLAEDVIRPITKRLVNFPDQLPISASLISVSKVQWNEVLKISVSGQSIYALPSCAWLTSASFAFLAPTYGLPGVASALLGFGASFTLLYLASIAWKNLPAHFGIVVRFFLLTGIFIIQSYVHYLCLGVFTSFDDLRPNRFIPLALVIVTIDWLTTIVFSIYKNQRSINDQLHDLNDSLQHEVVHLNRQYRQLHTGIARVLHGPVQDSIAAALFVNESRDPSHQISVDELNQRIESTLSELLLAENANSSVVDSFNDLAVLWSPIANFTFECDRQSLEIIKNDAVLNAAIIEVVREAASNAIRHGSAKNVHAEITYRNSDKSVWVNVQNDGSRIDESAKPGIGSQIFDELTYSWTRHSSGIATNFEALMFVDF